MAKEEEILAMEAGIELDKLIAEAFEDYTDEPESVLAYKNQRERIYHHFLPNRGGGWTVPAPVSTDISAAWLVVEKLIDIHPQGDFHLEHLEDEWCCGWCYPPSGADLDNWICGKTAPEAICKAALLTRLDEIKRLEGGSVKEKRSLYQCFNAKVRGDRIYCAKGHTLSMAKDGTIAVTRMARGEPLQITACQECPDYDEMGSPVPPEDRGWVPGQD